MLKASYLEYCDKAENQAANREKKNQPIASGKTAILE